MRFLILLTFTFLILFGDIFSTYEIEIDNNTTAINSPDIIAGETGIVIKDNKYITNYAFTKPSNNNKNIKILTFKEYKSLDKDFFKLPDKKPKAKDKILFGHLNKRAMIICNSRKDFIKIEKEYDKIDFIHPDMLASHLAVEYDPSPALDDFRSVASDFYFGLYMFCLPKLKKIAIVDSLSLNVLKLQEYNPVDTTTKELPFYTRIENIETSIFNFDDDRVQDYSKYYTKLLKIDK